MMRRSWPNRAAALVWALLFLLNSAGSAFGLHPCPHHDGPGRHPAGHVAGDMAADMAAHAGHGAHAPAPADPGHHAAPCTCAGDCQASAAIGVPAVGASVAVGETLATLAGPLAAASDLLPARYPPYFFPFGLAPPALG